MRMNRRTFMEVTATASGLLLAVSLMSCKPAPPRYADPPGEQANLTVWILIAPDDTITLRINRSEMGQGVYTSLAMLLAEELEADWHKVRVEHAPVEPETYGDQTTRLSNAIRDNWDPLRKAGAAAREMLIAAAAKRFGVDPATCRAELSMVIHEASGRRIRYGEVAFDAAAMPIPDKPKLKRSEDFDLLGKPIARLDTPNKLDGKAVFGIDVKVQGMLVAVVARCPIFGGSLGSFDARAAKAVPGVVAVFEIPSGIAVVANHFWAAKQGRDALSIQWKPGPRSEISTADVFRELRAAIDTSKPVQTIGKPARILDRATRKLEAVYEVPYLAAAPMEPLGCTAHVRSDACEIWISTQAPVFTREAIAKMLGLPMAAVKVHVTLLGGGFGRRKQLDFAVEAVHVSKALQRPVKVVWTMEDVIAGGMYRPAACNVMTGAVDARGRPRAWTHRIATQALPPVFERTILNGIDVWAVGGAVDLPYDIPHRSVGYAMADLPVPVWFWRGIGHSYNAFVTECFFDELCALGRSDPLSMRLELLSSRPRHARALKLAAEKAGWGNALPAGHARGLAVHESFGSICAQVAEVSLADGKPRVHRIVCAIDCGGVVNPDTIVAQMEGSIIYALTMTLYGKIDIDKGRAVQNNYDDYKLVRLPETPIIDTHIIATGDPLGGIGEPGLAPTAPAVCNALRALTGKPVRKLPLLA